jgi:hypothetical protein
VRFRPSPKNALGDIIPLVQPLAYSRQVAHV